MAIRAALSDDELVLERARMPSRRTSLVFVAIGLLGQSLIACAGSPQKSATATSIARSPSAAIDARLQGIADDEASRVRAEWRAERLAIVVLDLHGGVGQPKKEGTGGTIAAPVFARIATRALSP
jgi:hypothetical protein